MLRRWWMMILLAFVQPAWAEPLELLNVSFDPTRELYEAYNARFEADWKKTTGQEIKIVQSHGGSGKQARSVIDGLRADVVTLALAYDIDAIAQRTKLLPADWSKALPSAGVPFYSTIVFLVREGNPKQIRDWADLVRPGTAVIMPNPKTSGGARWNYLAALAYAQKKHPGNDHAAKDFVQALYRNVPVLDTGARGSTTTFVQRGIGDVLVTWESEAMLAKRNMRDQKLEIVYPSISIKAETPVAVVEENAKAKGTLEAARAYVKRLYSEDAQRLAAEHFYRPTQTSLAKDFPAMPMTTIAELGGWDAMQKQHFDDGGWFDEIYQSQ